MSIKAPARRVSYHSAYENGSGETRASLCCPCFEAQISPHTDSNSLRAMRVAENRNKEPQRIRGEPRSGEAQVGIINT